MKITMLGTTGVGKTTFLAAMYNELGRKSRNDFKIRASNLDLDSDLGLVWKNISTMGVWPDGTMDYSQMQFALEYKFQTVMNFEFVDYRGGVIIDNSSKEDVKKLFDDIAQSDALMILADSWFIMNTDEVIAEAKSEIYRIQNLLEKFYFEHPNKKLIVAIVLTKFDTVEEYMIDEFERKCQYLFSNIINLSKNQYGNIEGAFFPVSVTGFDTTDVTVQYVDGSFIPNVRSKLLKPPKPINAHWPVLYCVSKKLEQEIRRKLELLSITTGNIESLSKKTGFLDDFLSWLNKEESNADKVNDLKNQKEKYRMELENLRSKLIPFIAEVSNLPDLQTGRLSLPEDLRNWQTGIKG